MAPDAKAERAHGKFPSGGQAGWAKHAVAPRPLDDELLYSVFARCKGLLGVDHSSVILGTQTKGDASTFRVTLPDRLDALVATGRFAHKLDVVDLIERRTILPYFSRFLSPDAWTRVIRSMRGTWPRGGYDGLGYMHGVGSWPKRLRLCPACLEQDVEEQNAAAWRRTHQLPGVFLCPWHSVPLRESEVRLANQFHLVACPIETGTSKAITSTLDLAVALRVAKGSDWLLRNPGPPVPAPVLQTAMRSLIGDRGWLAPNGMARPGFVAALENRYGRELTAELGMAFDSRRSRKAAQRLWGTATPLGVAPLACLLALDFLDADVGELFSRCRVNAVGAAPKNRRAPNPREATLLQHRKTLTATMRDSPRLGRRALRAECNVSYCYLNRNDPAWLETNLPPKRRARIRSGWKTKDKMLARLVKETIGFLSDAPGRPVGLTRARIVEAMGQRTTLFRRDKRLPRTMAAIKEARETRERYRERVLRWAAKQFHERGEFPTWSCFCRRASFKACETPELELLARKLHADLTSVDRLSIQR